MCNKKEIAAAAELIVNGYAFTVNGQQVRVLNLSRDSSACVLSLSGELLETTMDDIEQEIVLDYYKRNKQFLSEADHA